LKMRHSVFGYEIMVGRNGRNLQKRVLKCVSSERRFW
jgi:hypothetical protein